MEHLDVVIVGAGLSGIGAAHHLQDKCPWASYAVLEARDAIGGTWDLFRYPGIRSDSDMYTLGYSFRPWDGEKTIADGESILQYIRDTATDAGIDRHIRFHHRITSADWSSAEARWHLVAQRSDTDEQVELTCDFLFSCTGYYRYDHGYEPAFAGREQFEGTIVHPQHWPQDLEYAGKRVVVIGSGATAVTLVPAMATDAAQVTMLQRSPTYIASVPQRNPLARLLRKVLPERAAGAATRWALALGTQGSYRLSKRRPELMRKILRRGLERELPAGYDIDTHFTPRYDPWDQRLCAAPDGDFFRAIRHGDVEVVTDTIERFDATGIRLSSGEHLDADVIVTATGLELLFLGGIDLRVDGEAVDVSERLTYRGMMLEGVPNLAIAVGYTNASWTLKCDLTCDYVTRLLNHLRDRGLASATPRNHGGAVAPEPLLGLSSGYIQRAADRFPKQGSVAPWQVHQSYLRDHRSMKRDPLIDDALELARRPAVVAGTGTPEPAATR